MPKPINTVSKDDLLDFQARPTLERYQKLATRFAVYPGQGTFLGLLYAAGKMAAEAGELNEKILKAMRDNDVVPTGSENGRRVAYLDADLPAELADRWVKELGDVLWYASATANELNARLDYVAGRNLGKLADRTARGVLQGNGDDR